VGDCGIERRSGHSKHRSAHAGAKQVERPHRQPEAMVDLAEYLVCRGHHAVKLEPADRMRR